MDKLDLKSNHYLHGLGIAGILYLFTRNIPASAAGGIAAGIYMQHFGHSLPTMEARKPDRKAPTPHQHHDLREHNHNFNPLHRPLTL